MQPCEGAAKLLAGMAGRLADASVRDLFIRFCSEIACFSDSVVMEVAPFEVLLSGPYGFRLHVSPYRDLFRVSIESASPWDVRVSAKDGYVSALDLALKSFLDAHERTCEETGTGRDPDPDGAHTAPHA